MLKVPVFQLPYRVAQEIHRDRETGDGEAGKTAIHGAVVMYACASLIIRPQSGVGGCTPSPRNPRRRS